MIINAYRERKIARLQTTQLLNRPTEVNSFGGSYRETQLLSMLLQKRDTICQTIFTSFVSRDASKHA